MEKSNLIAGSNVYIIHTEDPRWDKEFMEQIEELEKLERIKVRREVDRRICEFTPIQEKILAKERRCVYAKKDPCWGLKGKTKVVSACVNGACPYIKECNPRYTKEDAAFWTMKKSDKENYKGMASLPLYYFVDMVSETEMHRYEMNPKYDGVEYSLMRNPVIPETTGPRYEEYVYIHPLDGKRYKVCNGIYTDMQTGQRLVVVGYRWVILDNASYESEDQVPILDVVKEVQETVPVKKAKKLEVQEDLGNKPVLKDIRGKNAADEDSDYIHKAEYEESVRNQIQDTIKLSVLTEEMLGSQKIVILVDNQAEKSYVSSNLLGSDVRHGFTEEDKVQVAIVDDYSEIWFENVIFISSKVLETGCKKENVRSWKALAKENLIYELNIPDRDYDRFEYGDGQQRWCCRNGYGITHICMELSDVEKFEECEDGIYLVDIEPVDEQYEIILREDGYPAGTMSKSFIELIHAMIDKDEITGEPDRIKGLAISLENGQMNVLGMGHMRFPEY